jgi:hypothetical protein
MKLGLVENNTPCTIVAVKTIAGVDIAANEGARFNSATLMKQCHVPVLSGRPGLSSFQASGYLSDERMLFMVVVKPIRSNRTQAQCGKEEGYLFSWS